MKKKQLTFYIGMVLLQLGANMAHPVTPMFISTRGLTSSMFGYALAGAMATQFLVAPLYAPACDDALKPFLLGSRVGTLHRRLPCLLQNLYAVAQPVSQRHEVVALLNVGSRRDVDLPNLRYEVADVYGKRIDATLGLLTCFLVVAAPFFPKELLALVSALRIRSQLLIGLD